MAFVGVCITCMHILSRVCVFFFLKFSIMSFFYIIKILLSSLIFLALLIFNSFLVNINNIFKQSRGRYGEYQNLFEYINNLIFKNIIILISISSFNEKMFLNIIFKRSLSSFQDKIS